MKSVQLAAAIAAIGLLATSALAQSVRMPDSTQSVAFGYDAYVMADQPSAEPPRSGEAAKPEEAKQGETNVAPAEEESADEPYRVIGKVGRSDFNIYGWLDMGGTVNADNPASGYNGTLAPNDRNQFQFNQLYMVGEKVLDTSCGWDFGGRVDLLYGTDYIFTQSTGFETFPDGSRRWNSGIDYGLAMPQIYGEVGYDRLSLKLGRFYTIIGYESMMAVNNFFYSHNYAVRYNEPTSHTGGLFTWKQSDELSFYLGGVNGQDRTDAVVDSCAALTGFAYTPEEKKWALAFGLMTGGLEPTTADPAIFAPRTYFSTYFTYNFTEKFQSVTQWDAGWQQNYDLAGNTADFWSVTQYLFYTLNDCWKAGLRYDMMVDDQGTRLGGLRYGGLPGGNPLPLPSGDAGTVQAISAGLNYTFNPNIRIRPEVRWDWYGGNGPRLFDDLSKDNQFTAAVDAIIQF